MKYIKRFKLESEYELYRSGEEFITPNVSFVDDYREVFFNPFYEEKTEGDVYYE